MPFFDIQQVNDAVRHQALPALEQFAANPSHRRFERDEPPPYVSSESEDEATLGAALTHAFSGNDTQQNREFDALVHAPLNEDEQVDAAGFAWTDLHPYKPGERYMVEAEKEKDRLQELASSGAGPASAYLSGTLDRRRWGPIVRRNIRRRWQKLGVWNPEWGIPERTCDSEASGGFGGFGLKGRFPGEDANYQPHDDPDTWKWKWQDGEHASEWKFDPELNAGHVLRRAVRHRQGLRHGEHNPPPPFSSLKEDATAGQAESFIMSRPWFTFQIEAAEQSQRLQRLPNTHQAHHYRGRVFKPIGKIWKERGDYREDWSSRMKDYKHPLGWKWRHESPSPEPEDLSFIGADDFSQHYTPSEADALENLQISTSRPSSPKPAVLPPGSLFGPGPRAVPEAPVNGFSEPRHSVPESGPAQRRRGSPRRGQTTVLREPAQPRRSARIRARVSNGDAASLSPDRRGEAAGDTAAATRPVVPSYAPPKPARRGPGRAAARPVPSRPPPPEVGTSRGRGRQKKTGGPDKPSGVSKTASRASKSGGGRRANLAAAAAEESTLVTTNGSGSSVKRGRGRPRTGMADTVSETASLAVGSVEPIVRRGPGGPKRDSAVGAAESASAPVVNGTSKRGRARPGRNASRV